MNTHRDIDADVARRTDRPTLMGMLHRLVREHTSQPAAGIRIPAFDHDLVGCSRDRNSSQRR